MDRNRTIDLERGVRRQAALGRFRDMGVSAGGEAPQALQVSSEMLSQAATQKQKFVEGFCRIADCRTRRSYGAIVYEQVRFVQ
jgi:hypothetical protein